MIRRKAKPAPLPDFVTDQIVSWGTALKMLHISRTAARERVKRDERFAALRLVVHRGRHGRPTYGAKLSEVEAYMNSLRAAR